MSRAISFVVFTIVSCGVLGRGPLQFTGRETYAVETTVQLQEAARRERDVAYKVTAALSVENAWQSGGERLLRFELTAPQLLTRGVRARDDFLPHASVWDSYPRSQFYAFLKDGLVQRAYLDANELSDVLNYKRSLISLFQLQDALNEGNETDVSGTCRVGYETLSENILRKIKSECEGEWGETRRITRYSLVSSVVETLHAEEVHEVRIAGGNGVKARTWIRLNRVTSSAGASPANDITTALASIPAHLTPQPVRPDLPHIEELPIQVDSESAEEWEVDEGGSGGKAADAWRALRARDTLCSASRARLMSLIEHVDRSRLPAVLRALGSCATAVTHAVADDLLQLRVPSSPLASLAPHYLAAVALAPNPQASVVEELLELSAWPRDDSPDELATSALASLGAAARRLRQQDSASRLAATAFEKLKAALVACSTERCRVAHLRALANLAHGGSVEELLTWAERGTESEALAALDALDMLCSEGTLASRVWHRLGAVSASGRPLAVRAAALDVLLRAAADAPFTLLPLVLQLTNQAEGELVRVLWQRLVALDDRASMFRAALPPTLRARALFAAATSAVLRRELPPPQAAPAASSALDSVQVARGGALRRGLVRLSASGDPNGDDALAVELTATGLDGLMGSGGDDEPAAAALALTVGNVRLPPVTLFNGQAELAAHVWAGTASVPTPALRALRPLAAQKHALRLLDGSALHYQFDALAALALDAHAQVSVWSRSARAGVETRGGVAARALLATSAAWGALSAAAELTLEPQLRIATDVDFYDGIALCVRVRAADHPQTLRVTLQSKLGTDRRAVRRWSERAWAAPGRTLSLGTELDSSCRTLVSADD